MKTFAVTTTMFVEAPDAEAAMDIVSTALETNENILEAATSAQETDTVKL